MAARRRAPKRTCICCREGRQKGSLLRLVRLPDGRVYVDASGRQPGRGAYVCRSEECVHGLRPDLVSRALRAAVSASDLAALVSEMEALLERADEAT